MRPPRWLLAARAGRPTVHSACSPCTARQRLLRRCYPAYRNRVRRFRGELYFFPGAPGRGPGPGLQTHSRFRVATSAWPDSGLLDGRRLVRSCCFSSVQRGSAHVAAERHFTFCEGPEPAAVTLALNDCDAAHWKKNKDFALTEGAYSLYSISNSILADFSSMADTEQYFSFDRRTPSSMALCDTLTLTRYTNLISVNTLGCSPARSAFATTSRPVNGSRFLRKMPT